MKSLEARYENGVLRPLEKLALHPGERVNIIVMRHANPDRWDLARLAQSTQEETTLAEQGIAAWARAIDTEDKI